MLRRALIIIGIALLALDVIGRFVSLRNPAIYSETRSQFRPPARLTERQFLAIAQGSTADRRAFVREVTLGLNQAMIHYWEDDAIRKYNLTIPAYNNYMLYLASFICPAHYRKYEIQGWRPALQRGAGLCSQHAVILSRLLEERGIKNRIIGLGGHVVTAAEVDPTSGDWWLLDADYGVVLEHDLHAVEANPVLIRDAYTRADIDQQRIRTLVRIYGAEENRIYGSADEYAHGRMDALVERLTYVLIWVLPVLMLGIAFLMPGRRRTIPHGTRPMRICFLVRQLNVAGAENQLVMLIKGLDKSRWSVTALTFYSGGLLFDEVARVPGVRLVSLRKSGRWDVLPFMCRLIRELRAADPDILYAFLGISNILAVLAKPFLRGTRIVWSVRASDMDLHRYGRLHVLAYRLECVLSRFAGLVIANSHAGRDYSVSGGFPASRTVVVPNGTDTDRFAPDEEARRKMRTEWNVRDDEVLVGLIGRVDPMKDHATFLKAAAILVEKYENVRFVCVGRTKGDYADEMMSLGESLGLADKLIWAGVRMDMPAVHNALDVMASSSLTEGFPNVVSEAMACGTPCVVTDVGDSRVIVGDQGIVVPKSDPVALAEAISRTIDGLTGGPSMAARARIAENFSRDRMIKETEKHLCSL